MSDLSQPNIDNVKVPLRDVFGTRRLIQIGVYQQTWDYSRSRQLSTAADTERWENLRTRSLAILKEIWNDNPLAA